MTWRPSTTPRVLVMGRGGGWTMGGDAGIGGGEVEAMRLRERGGGGAGHCRFPFPLSSSKGPFITHANTNEIT
jgi:hypothetical protein